MGGLGIIITVTIWVWLRRFLGNYIQSWPRESLESIVIMFIIDIFWMFLYAGLFAKCYFRIIISTSAPSKLRRVT